MARWIHTANQTTAAFPHDPPPNETSVFLRQGPLLTSGSHPEWRQIRIELTFRQPYWAVVSVPSTSISKKLDTPRKIFATTSMKYPTLYKVGLTTIALAASLALSAQAGQPRLSSTHGRPLKRVVSTSANLSPNTPASTYEYDDGTSEQGVAFVFGVENFEAIWLNQFAVIPGQTSITSVDVVWGTPLAPGWAPNGTPVTIGVWSDPNGDGDPTDGVLLGSVAGTVQNSDTDTFVTYTFSPAVDLPAGATSFFVGDMTPMNNGPDLLFWQGQDTSDSAPNKSWVLAMGDGSAVDLNNLGNNDFLHTIDSQGLPGNWLIRANSGNASPTPTPTPTPMGDALWYNGDFDGIDGLNNQQDASTGDFYHIYDDFNVNDSGGWDVRSVFSDNLTVTTVTGATWEIRQGITSGNGGTLIASGTTMTPVVTATGRSGFGFTEFMVEVTGLSVHLDPGTYHLNVTPISELDGNGEFNSTTSGANCIGTPCGDNDNAFLDGPVFFANYEPVADFGSQFHDFSMGVNGVVSGGGGGITLTAKIRQEQGKPRVALEWSPADGGSINVLRDGVVIHTTNDDGRAQDRVGGLQGGTYTYQVCETGTSNCSNTVTVQIK